ncbi:hypothetical protein GYMLUDRAFT_250576 [Collybiopsis luxurians FD-317 M1]|uniref:DNA polymerase delta subunit 4 n=1 Tax=Collybiopsis luxurians FD-317 M1 TaxID=944289 RepID=A0A0D0C5M3_9AGAR|nr:hypothetical protein GYMLUDRAFT_250576 [Collybiopsis luxurians FD-317 M1]
MQSKKSHSGRKSRQEKIDVFFPPNRSSRLQVKRPVILREGIRPHARSAHPLQGVSKISGHSSRGATRLSEEHLRLLKEFDLDPMFGPCVGLERLDRWQRAFDLGLNPPQNIREILQIVNAEESHPWREATLTTLVGMGGKLL